MQKVTLVFLGYIENLLSCESLLKKAGRKDSIIYSQNRFFGELSKKIGLDIKYSEAVLKEEDYKYMDSYISMVNDNSCLDLKGKTKDIAETLQLDFYLALCSAIKNLHIILKLIENHKPAEVVFISENDEDFFDGISRFLGSTLDIKTECIKMKKSYSGVFSNSLILLRDFVTTFISEIVDFLCRLYLTKKREKRKDLILMDYRLNHTIRDIDREFTVIPFILGKGLRVRWSLLKKKKVYFSFFNRSSFFSLFRSRKVLKEFGSFIKVRFKNDIFKYKDYDIGMVLENLFMSIFKRGVVIFQNNLCLISNFLRKIKPKIILLRDSVRSWEYLFISASKKCNIASLVVQHGLMTEKNIYTRQNADFMACWGKADVEWFKKLGSDPKRLVITGNPSFDYIYDRENGRIDRYKEILRKINADPDLPTLVYLGNSIRYYPINTIYLTPDLSLFSLEATLNTFRELKGIQLIVKVHPYYTKSELLKFKKMISEFKNVFLLKDADISDLFSGAKAIITEKFSSAIMDAIQLRKPVLFYNFFKREELIPLEARGVGIEIREPSKIREGLEKAIRNSEFFLDNNLNSFIEDYAYKVDGKASERVKEFLRELVTR
ncbi:CDP-glycerol glycerophosphotransferase family protein [Candidatus Omnitrophota bacterium]